LIEYSPDGERFAVGYNSYFGSSIGIYQAADGNPLVNHIFGEPVGHLNWEPDGRQVAVADHSGSVTLMETRSGVCRTLGRHKAQAVWTVFRPDGDYLISGGWDRELICWDVRTLQRAFGIDLDAFHAEFRRDGRMCAITQRSTLILHEFEPPAGHKEFPEDLGGRVVHHGVFSSDGRWLAVAGQERLAVWDLWAGGAGATTSQGADARLCFSEDSSELFACQNEGIFRWRLTAGAKPRDPPVLTPVPMRVPPGLNSVCASSNQIAWTSSLGTRFFPLDGNPTAPPWLSTSAGLNGASGDGRWLAVFRPFSPLLYVYRMSDLGLVTILTNHANIAEFQFSPRGDELAVCSSRQVEIWSTVTWERRRELTNFGSVIYAPDAKSWWLTKDYRNAGLYDAQTQELLLPLPAGMLPLALSRDGRSVAVSVDARRVQVWDLVAAREQLRELALDWPER
jgi:WD40 repeat protein